MTGKSKIQWTDATWNPLAGCSIVSPGCTNCYAMRQAARIERMGGADHYVGLTEMVKGKPVWTGRVALASEKTMRAPLRRKKPRKIFVNSMSDLFHESVPDEWIDRIFVIAALSPQHIFQILTKRPKRMRDYVGMRAGDWQVVLPEAFAPGTLPISKHGVVAHIGVTTPEHRSLYGAAQPCWPLPNVWLGVTAEDQTRADERREDLRATPAVVKFVSYEPALGPIDWAGWEFIDQIIFGGESGPGARPAHPQWPRDTRDFCAEHGIAYFFKQWGEWIGVPDLRNLPDGGTPGFGAYDHCFYDMKAEAVRVGKHRAGRLLDGREHNDFPEAK